MSSMILDFELTPANCTDLEAGYEPAGEHTTKCSPKQRLHSCRESSGTHENNRILLHTILEQKPEEASFAVYESMYRAMP